MTRPSASTWPEERYAAGEGLAKATRRLRSSASALPPSLRPIDVDLALTEVDRALAEYERTRDHP